MRGILLSALILLGGAPAAVAQGATGGAPELRGVVYKNPWCGCCGSWVRHMREAGFELVVHDVEDMSPFKRAAGVPEELQSCHTAVVGGYVIEGHVPAADIRRLLAEAPQARGLSVPGMVIGSPGMESGGQREPYQVLLFSDGRAPSVYAAY